MKTYERACAVVCLCAHTCVRAFTIVCAHAVVAGRVCAQLFCRRVQSCVFARIPVSRCVQDAYV